MALKLLQILGLCLLAASCFGERARYDNYRLYQATASSEQELEVLRNLEGSSDSVIFLHGINQLNKPIQMVVAPHKVPDFLEIMASRQIKYKLLEKDFQSQLENSEEELGTFNTLARASSYDWDHYYGVNDTYEWMEKLAVEYPDKVTLIEGGQTYQGRVILGVKISRSMSEKPGVFIEAGIHAREWIGPATATYIIYQLLTSNDDNIKDVAEKYDWYIFPHTNPDGHVYSREVNRLWRKTRTDYGSCFGADPNRNWDFQWNVVGASNNPCTDNYAGPNAFSESETRTLADYINSLKGKISLYLSLHAFSQLLLFPYGHTSELPPNYDHFKIVADAAVAAIAEPFGTQYDAGNIYDIIYPAAGASIDYAYGVTGIKMSFCYELRPNRYSPYGFRLPTSQITPTGIETLNSIVAMVGEVERLGYFV